MDSCEESSRKSAVKLSDNSIVNIDGVQARLVLDPDTGGIKVIPLGRKNDVGLQRFNKIHENLPTALSIHSPSEPVEQSHTVQAENRKLHALNETKHEPRMSNVLVTQNTISGLSAMTAGADVTLAKPQGEEHSRDMTQGNVEVEVEIDMSIQTSEQMSYTEDGLGGHLDRHLEGDAMEQDMLEQLLNSVTRDLQYIGAATNEVPAPVVGDQSNLFLTSSRLSFLRSIPPVSAEALFPDFHLPKQGLYMTQNQEGGDPERLPEKGGPSPEDDFPSWQFTADDVEMMTCSPKPSPNNPARTGPSLDLRHSQTNQDKILQNVSNDVKSRTVQEQVKKRGRQPRVRRTYAYGQEKLKRLQPKPALHTVLLISAPVNQKQLYPGGLPLVTSAVPSASVGITQCKEAGDSAKEEKVKNKLEIQNRISVVQESSQSSQIETLTVGMTRKSQTNQLEENYLNLPQGNISQTGDDTSEMVCNVCNASFLSGSSAKFISHFLSHQTACVVCKEMFDTETELFQHLCGHKVRLIHDDHGAVEFRCEICECQFLHASNMQRHLVCVHGMKPDSSTDLNMGSSEINGGSSLSKSTSRERHRRVMCHQCGKQLGSKSLSIHLKLHCHANNPDRNTSPVLCFECNGLFLNLLTFKKHLQTTCRAQVSESDADHQRLTVNCPLCRKVVSLSSVSTHQRLYCPAAPPTRETCQHCGAVLRHKHSLRNHLRWHCKQNPDADSPTKCVCGKTFRNFKAFQSHYQNHCPGKIVPQPTSGVGLGRQ